MHRGGRLAGRARLTNCGLLSSKVTKAALAGAERNKRGGVAVPRIKARSGWRLLSSPRTDANLQKDSNEQSVLSMSWHSLQLCVERRHSLSHSSVKLGSCAMTLSGRMWSGHSGKPLYFPNPILTSPPEHWSRLCAD